MVMFRVRVRVLFTVRLGGYINTGGRVSVRVRVRVRVRIKIRVRNIG